MRKFLSPKIACAQALMICCVLTLVIGIRPVEASNTIYIKPDGSIDPSSAPISRNDSIYYFTNDINESIIIEKSAITVDGYGHTLQGSGEGAGFVLAGTYNVTIRNTNIRGYETGIILNSTSAIIVDNNITDNNNGVVIAASSYCLILRNYISTNDYGVYISSSFNNTFYHNSFVNNTSAQAYVLAPFDSNFWDNGYPVGGNYWSDYGGTDAYRGLDQNITGSDGIGDTGYLVVGEGEQEDNYPLMGSFRPLTEEGLNVSVYPTDHVWLTFAEIILSGVTTVNVPESAPDPPPGFIVEQCYVIDTSAIYLGTVSIRIIYDDFGGTIDAEPRRLMRVVPVRGDVNDDFIVNILDIVSISTAFGSERGDSKYTPKYDLNGDGIVNILDLVIAAGHYGQLWNPETGWEDITDYVDAQSKLVIGETDHLSIFGVTRAGMA